MTSSRPYLMRAIYQWIVDNDMTPHVLVDATDETVRVPRNYVENGKIVLNIGPMAVRGLDMGNEALTFNGRFGGQPMDVDVPVWRVLAIYARENGQGMMFGEEEGPPPPEPTDTDKESEKKPSGPNLKVVK